MQHPTVEDAMNHCKISSKAGAWGDSPCGWLLVPHCKVTPHTFFFEIIHHVAFMALVSFTIPASQTNRIEPSFGIVSEGNSRAALATSV